MTVAWAALRFAWTNVFQPFSALANNIMTAGNSFWLAALKLIELRRLKCRSRSRHTFSQAYQAPG